MIRSESQVLITGVYRTGSEYISQLIGCHPRLDVSMYRVNVLRFMAGRYDPIQETGNQMAALSDLNQRLKERYSMTVDIPAVMSVLAGESRVGYGALYDAVMTHLYLGQGCRIWAEKNQLLWRQIPDFLEMMPNGKTILILRDPRAVLASFKKYTYADPPAYVGAVFNCLDAMNHAAGYEKKLPREQYLTVQYEAVVADPEMEISRIWSFLGLDPSGLNLSNRGWKDAYGKDWHINSAFQGNDPNEKFDIERALNGWQQNLSAPEIFLTQEICADMMAHFSYETCPVSSDWPTAMRLFVRDDTIMAHFRKWLVSGKGIQAFPTDPLIPENWEKS